jgi:tetratricopeptide (TPR) repeat protein
MMGQADAAKVAFEEALRVSKDFDGKEEAQARLKMISVSTGAEAISIEALEKLLSVNQTDILAWMRLGSLFQDEKNIPKAADAYERARQINPASLAPNLKLAQLNVDVFHNNEKAIEFAKKARELAPHDPVVGGTLGVIALRAGNYEWAYGLLRQAARETKPTATVLHAFAWSAYDLGKVNEARKVMQSAAFIAVADSFEKKDSENFLALTAIEEDWNTLNSLQERIQTTLATQPNYVPALMGKAALQMLKGSGDEAAAIYGEILERYPNFAPAQRELAWFYSQKEGSLAKASDLAAKARESLSDDDRLSRILAEISFKRKEFTYAVQLFQESARKRPLDAGSLYRLGVAELETKKTADGMSHLRAALAAGLDGNLKTDAEHRIADADKK